MSPDGTDAARARDIESVPGQSLHGLLGRIAGMCADGMDVCSRACGLQVDYAIGKAAA